MSSITRWFNVTFYGWSPIHVGKRSPETKHLFCVKWVPHQPPRSLSQNCLGLSLSLTFCQKRCRIPGGWYETFLPKMGRFFFGIYFGSQILTHQSGRFFVFFLLLNHSRPECDRHLDRRLSFVDMLSMRDIWNAIREEVPHMDCMAEYLRQQIFSSKKGRTSTLQMGGFWFFLWIRPEMRWNNSGSWIIGIPWAVKKSLIWACSTVDDFSKPGLLRVYLEDHPT